MKTFVVVLPDSVSAEAQAMLHFASQAMADKFVAAEAKHEWKDAWRSLDDPNRTAVGIDPERDCRRYLIHHLAKGDPRDLMVIAAFMLHFGWSAA